MVGSSGIDPLEELWFGDGSKKRKLFAGGIAEKIVGQVLLWALEIAAVVQKRPSVVYDGTSHTNATWICGWGLGMLAGFTPRPFAIHRNLH